MAGDAPTAGGSLNVSHSNNDASLAGAHVSDEKIFAIGVTDLTAGNQGGQLHLLVHRKLRRMGLPAARLTDMHVCPMVTGVVPHVGGPIIGPGSPNVFTGGLPQARATDMCVCVGPPDPILPGATTVFINNLLAARLGDMTAHGGIIILGLPTVLIGANGGGG